MIATTLRVAALGFALASLACTNRVESESPTSSGLRVNVENTVHLTTEEMSQAVQMAMSGGGVPVFRQVGPDAWEPVDCSYPGRLTYQALTPTGTNHSTERVTGGTLVIGAPDARAGLRAGGGHEKAYQMEVAKAGYWSFGLKHPTMADLLDCAEATHVAKEIFVGAFEEIEHRSARGGGRVAAYGVGVGVEHGHSETNLERVGNLDYCTVEALKGAADEPPLGCDSPIRMTLVPIERKVNYYFEQGFVTGAHSQQVTLTSAELKEIGELLELEVRERAQVHDIQVVHTSRPGSNDVRCRVISDPNPNRYLVDCMRGEESLLQVLRDRGGVSSGVPVAAAELIHTGGEVGTPPRVGRLVFLIDVSTSMLINDEQTFLNSDPRNSSRFGIVDATLDGLLTEGIHPEVSLVAFAGSGCATPAPILDTKLWPLTHESKKQGLAWLTSALQELTCADGTDFVTAFRMAKTILDASPKSESGHDAVVLITDGSHHPNVGSPTAAMEPHVEADLLVEAGVQLHIIRVQLNHLESFRKLLDNKRTRDKVLARWKKVKGESYDGIWREEIETISGENKDGSQLLRNLQSVELGSVVLNEDDLSRNSLTTVHQVLLPALGTLGSIDARNCSQPGDRLQHGFRQMDCELGNVPLGREFVVKVWVAPCMANIVAARVVGSEDIREVKPSSIQFDSDAMLVEFEATTLRADTKGIVTTVPANLIVKAKPGAQCE